MGNWTSIVKGNVIFTYRENQQDTEIVADPNGRPIRLLFNENRFDAGGMTRLECKQTSAGSYINVSEVQNTTAQRNNGERFPTIGSINAVPSVDIDEYEDLNQEQVELIIMQIQMTEVQSTKTC